MNCKNVRTANDSYNAGRKIPIERKTRTISTNYMHILILLMFSFVITNLCSKYGSHDK